MLTGKRTEKVGEQILRMIADLLMEKVRDPRIEGVTLTGVNLSNDLKQARVFFSIIGQQREINDALTGLESAKGYIKKQMGLRSRLRYVPDIVFEYDSTLETGDRIEKLIKKINEE